MTTVAELRAALELFPQDAQVGVGYRNHDALGLPNQPDLVCWATAPTKLKMLMAEPIPILDLHAGVLYGRVEEN